MPSPVPPAVQLALAPVDCTTWNCTPDAVEAKVPTGMVIAPVPVLLTVMLCCATSMASPKPNTPAAVPDHVLAKLAAVPAMAAAVAPL